MTQIGFDIPDPDAPARPSAEELQPVVIQFARHHEFVKPETKPKRGKGRCQVCHRRFGYVEHHAFPEALSSDSGDDPMVWQTNKKEWQLAFGDALHNSGLPRGLESVMVVLKYTFPNRHRRDRDNLVYPCCKYLGDTMVRGRFIEVSYESIDWAFGAAGKDRYQVLDPIVAAEWGEVVTVLTRKPEAGKSVVIADPLGGWIPDDRWDRFEVMEMQAVYSKGVEEFEVMIMPSVEVPLPWPPEVM